MTLVKFTNRYPSLIDRFLNSDIYDWSVGNYTNTDSTLPSVNIKEDNDGFEVEVAAPGMEKGDFNIELNNNTLTISSEKEIKNETNEGQAYTRREFSYQSFRRSFALPNSVDSEKIKAKYENGILNIVIPKREEVKPKPKRLIEIL